VVESVRRHELFVSPCLLVIRVQATTPATPTMLAAAAAVRPAIAEGTTPAAPPAVFAANHEVY
jgi:hypothetical protein